MSNRQSSKIVSLPLFEAAASAAPRVPASPASNNGSVAASDFETLRKRAASEHGRKYWRSLQELADTPEFAEYVHREFPAQAGE